jgi:hypothetical protein
MTLPRLAVILERWLRVPALSVSVANIAMGLGVMKAPRSDSAPAQAANDEEMGTLIAAVGGVSDDMPDWLKAGLVNV